MNKLFTILYVADQQAATEFYSAVFDTKPTLNVPGMTEFKISESCGIGLMPVAGIKRLLGEALPDPSQPVPRAEIYLHVDDPAAYHQRALDAGAKELSPLQARDWGDEAAYILAADHHVIAFAKPVKS
ncbi:MAG: VOC family protein [Planctomycetota bacterium]|jgi:uncharacterized glyoxalase superfamily protein PhnB